MDNNFYREVLPEQHWQLQDNNSQWMYNNMPLCNRQHLCSGGEGGSGTFGDAAGGAGLATVPLPIDGLCVPAPRGRTASRQDNVLRREKKPYMRNASTCVQRKRKRTKFLSWQLMVLEEIFFFIAYPNIELREEIGKSLCLTESKIQIWFQNRRARFNKSRKKQTPLCRQESQMTDENDGVCCVRELLASMLFHANPYDVYNYQGDNMQRMAFQQAMGVLQSSQQFFGESPEYAEEQLDVYGSMRQDPQYSGSTAFYSNQMMENFEPSEMLHMHPEGDLNCDSQTTLSSTSNLIYNAAILTNEFEYCSI